MNPVQKAVENREALQARYQASKYRIGQLVGEESIICFLQRMACWTVSMNMRADDLEAFLDEGRHRNIYMKTLDELRDFGVISGGSGDMPTLDHAMEMDQKSWYPKRMAYHHMIESEGEIKYGALCAEGNGLSYYGPFTIFLARQAVESYAKMFIVKNDSLCYVDADHCFDSRTYLEDLALRENVLELALIKHESDLSQSCETAMQAHCYARSLDDRSYLEVQIYDEIKIDDAAEVRWGKTTDDDMCAIGRRKFNGTIDFRKPEDELSWMKYERFKRVSKKIRRLDKVITIFES